MLQTKFSLTEEQADFLNQHKKHDFKDKSAMVRAAIKRLQDELERQALKESADLYSEIYAEDSELREWTASAAEDWPELNGAGIRRSPRTGPRRSRPRTAGPSRMGLSSRCAPARPVSTR